MSGTSNELQDCRIAELQKGKGQRRAPAFRPFPLAILQSCNPAIQLMLIARVIGNLVSTQKHPKFEGAKLMLVQPLNADDTPRGAALLAVDSVGAGVTEKVLIVLEGRAAGEALGRKAAPVDAAIIGIIDRIDWA
jgi:microcompartment protein CcmK/EutM